MRSGGIDNGSCLDPSGRDALSRSRAHGHRRRNFQLSSLCSLQAGGRFRVPRLHAQNPPPGVRSFAGVPEALLPKPGNRAGEIRTLRNVAAT